MKIRKNLIAVALLPVLAFSLAACGSHKDDVVVDDVEIAQSDAAQSNDAMSGDTEIVVIDHIGVFDLEDSVKGYAVPDEATEPLGELTPGQYPLVEVDGDWKALEVVDPDNGSIVVWTNAKGETLLNAESEVVVEDGE